MEDLSNTIDRRNDALLKFFNKIFPNKIKLITLNPNIPSVIYNDEKCLSCYVHNFELRFTDAPDKGQMIYSIELKNSNTEYDLQKILNWFNNHEHKPMYRIMAEGTKPALFLSGFNYLDRENSKGKYPVFSHCNSRVYFTKEKALQIAQSFLDEGYNLLVK